jgi:hypothetical protein
VLIVLPLFFFITLYLNILGGKPKEHENGQDWLAAFLVATTIWGATVTFITEGLSPFNGISRLWVAISWAVALSLSIIIGWRKGTFYNAPVQIRLVRISLGKLDTLLLAGILALIITLGTVAWISPPNNTDSLQYHVPRIVNWIQNGSLRHYPTGFHPQL